MSQLKEIERALDAAGVPREVFIGTDSTADRVRWLIERGRLVERTSHKHFLAVERLTTLVSVLERIAARRPSLERAWQAFYRCRRDAKHALRDLRDQDARDAERASS